MEVAICVFRNNNQFLICERKEKYAGFWEFPGGKIEQNESSLQAIKREIKEELNIDVTPNFLFTFKNQIDDKIYHLHVFECFIDTKEINSNVHSNYAWITMNELCLYNTFHNTDTILKIIKNHAD